MKKIIYFFVIQFIIISFTSCIKISQSNEAGIAKRIGTNLVECINSKDVEGIKELFCTQSQKSDKIDKEIAGIFELIHSEIISYDITCNSGESVDNGKLTRQQETIFIDNIKTTDGNSYSIIIYNLSVYEKNTDYVGVSEIDIYIGDYGENDVSHRIGKHIKT